MKQQTQQGVGRPRGVVDAPKPGTVLVSLGKYDGRRKGWPLLLHKVPDPDGKATKPREVGLIGPPGLSSLMQVVRRQYRAFLTNKVKP